MSRINFMGKERTHISVGKGGSFDFTNPQSAWDSITDSAAEKPYVISLEPEIYEQDAQADGEPAWWFKDKTDITIVGTRGSILRKTGSGSSSGGGTVAIGADGELADRIRLCGFTVVNPQNGNQDGGAPEGAIYLGQENAHPTTLPYDQIELVNMHILGVHDALQLFGTIAPGTDGGPTVPPRVYIRNNLIESCHDAYTIKGGLQLLSCGNQINVNSAGIQPYLTSIQGWKHTGIHFNTDRGVTASIDRGRAFYRFTGDQIYVEANGNEKVGAGDAQEKTAGILVYNPSGAGLGLEYPDVRFVGCSVDFLNLGDDVYATGMAAIMLSVEDDITEGNFVFTGGDINIHQASTGNNPPTDVAGLLMRDTGTAVALISATQIRVRNDMGSSPMAFALQCEEAGSTIKHTGIIDRSTNGVSAGSGTITYENPLGHA